MWIHFKDSVCTIVLSLYDSNSLSCARRRFCAPRRLPRLGRGPVWRARGLQQNKVLPNHAGWNDALEAMMPVQPWIMTALQGLQNLGLAEDIFLSAKAIDIFFFPSLFRALHRCYWFRPSTCILQERRQPSGCGFCGARGSFIAKKTWGISGGFQFN